VSFTGSTAVGRLLMRQGADTMKRMFLELGGKSAAIVLDDANPAVIVPTAVGVCVHAGQACAATSRMLIHRSLYDQAVADITAAYQLVPVGDPVDPDTFVGPLISAAQKDRVLTAIERGAPGRRGHHRGWWPGAGPARAPGGRALRGAHGGGRHVQQRGDRTGSFGVNGGMFYGADAPFGGFKSSGIGRECGIEGFGQYLETKTIARRERRQG
jgi:aldehyde dehydrogenase (NAD+)